MYKWCLIAQRIIVFLNDIESTVVFYNVFWAMLKDRSMKFAIENKHRVQLLSDLIWKDMVNVEFWQFFTPNYINKMLSEEKKYKSDNSLVCNEKKIDCKYVLFLSPIPLDLKLYIILFNNVIHVQYFHHFRLWCACARYLCIFVGMHTAIWINAYCFKERVRFNGICGQLTCNSVYTYMYKPTTL